MPLLDRPRQRSGSSPAPIAGHPPSAIEPCPRDAKAARDGAPIPEPSPPALSTRPRQPKPGATIPIGRARPTAAPHLPAVSSPEASPTPADRAHGPPPATAGVREPLTKAVLRWHRQEGLLLRSKQTLQGRKRTSPYLPRPSVSSHPNSTPILGETRQPIRCSNLLASRARSVGAPQGGVARTGSRR